MALSEATEVEQIYRAELATAPAEAAATSGPELAVLIELFQRLLPSLPLRWRTSATFSVQGCARFRPAFRRRRRLAARCRPSPRRGVPPGTSAGAFGACVEDGARPRVPRGPSAGVAVLEGPRPRRRPLLLVPLFATSHRPLGGVYRGSNLRVSMRAALRRRRASKRRQQHRRFRPGGQARAFPTGPVGRFAGAAAAVGRWAPGPVLASTNKVRGGGGASRKVRGEATGETLT